MWRHTTTPYGPLPLAFGEPFAAWTGNPWLLVVGHRAVAQLGLVLLGWALPRLATWCGRPGAALLTRVRRLAAVALVSGAALVGLGVVTGLGTGWMVSLSVPGAVNTPLSLTTDVGGALGRLARHAGLDTAPTTFRDLARTLGSAAALAIAAWTALRAPTGSRRAAVTATAVVTGCWSRRSCRTCCSPRAGASGSSGSCGRAPSRPGAPCPTSPPSGHGRILP